jgi:hypothetical protein
VAWLAAADTVAVGIDETIVDSVLSTVCLSLVDSLAPLCVAVPMVPESDVELTVCVAV